MQTKLIIKIPLNDKEFDPNNVIDEIDRGNTDLIELVKTYFENVELAVEVGD